MSKPAMTKQELSERLTEEKLPDTLVLFLREFCFYLKASFPGDRVDVTCTTSNGDGIISISVEWSNDRGTISGDAVFRLSSMDDPGSGAEAAMNAEANLRKLYQTLPGATIQ